MLLIAVFVAAFAAAGVVAGGAGRLVLARLPRGVIVRTGPCELTGGVCFALIAASAATGTVPAWWLPVPVVVAALAVPLAAVDLACRRLPDALTYAAYPLFALALGAAALGAGEPGLLTGAAVGMVAFGGLHLLLHLIAPGSLGAGDVKLAGSLGGVLGALGPATLLLAGLLASAITLSLAVLAAIARAASSSAAPSRADTAAAIPAQANPAQANPAGTDPAGTNPAGTDPAAAVPAAADPAGTGPPQADPARGDPTRPAGAPAGIPHGPGMLLAAGILLLLPAPGLVS